MHVLKMSGSTRAEAGTDARRFQRSYSERQAHRRHAHPRLAPRHQGRAFPRGASAAELASGPPHRGRVRRKGIPRPGRRAPFVAPRRGGAAEARLAGRGLGRARARRAARELPFQQGREKGRRCPGEEDRSAVRYLRQRRLRRSPSRRGDHARRREIRSRGMRRAPHGGGDRGAFEGARAAGASAGRDRRRVQGLDQADRARRTSEGRPPCSEAESPIPSCSQPG
jgi:hypothetical protein